jgi:2-polyprenyl-6-methoxyphenol hydroxylase-like FAD-dependent oxidoreductase
MDGQRPPVAEPVCYGRPRAAVPATGMAEVVVVGAGIGGSLLALSLARLGVRVTVVDLHAVYPDDFRCEKLNPEQIAMLAELKLLGCFGADAANLAERGLRYDAMVAAARGAWPKAVRFVEGRATEVIRTDDIQTLVLADGQKIEGRLIVLATGPSDKLRASLGVRRKLVRERHSVCIGFTLSPPEGGKFDFDGLVHHGEEAGDGMAFASFFPLDGEMRVNLFAYRGPRDAWTLGFRDDPLTHLFDAMPGLEPLLAGAQVVSKAEIRATDLYETEGHDIDGVVLIGDAFRSCCPATGMGVTRILTEIRLLVKIHLPNWLATPGMGADKIAAFYADPAKLRIDEKAARRAETARSTSTQTSLPWRARRGLAELKRSVVAATRRKPTHHV